MEPDTQLLDRLLAASPWAFVVLSGLWLLRKEIGAWLTASRSAPGITQMVALFTQNLTYFAALQTAVEKLIELEHQQLDVSKRQIDLLQEIRMELVRRER